MLNKTVKQENPQERLLQQVAWVAGIFVAAVAVLMVANYIQLKKADPTNMKVITALVDRLNQSPNDNQLREEIRTLDLLSRKAYFTSQWQIRMGGYLMLAGLAVMIIALQWIRLNRKTDPMLEDAENENSFQAQKKTRRLIMAGGTVLLAVALVSGLLSNRELKSRISDASLMTTARVDSSQAGAPAMDTAATRQAQPVDTAKTALLAVASGSSGSQPAGPPAETKKVPAGSPADSYPTFRGPGGYGIAPQKNIPVNWDGASGKNILWKTEIPLPGYNSPVIWGDHIYLTGANDKKREVYCLDRNTGKLIWTAPVDNIPGSSAQVPQVTKETGFAAPTAAVNALGVFAVFPNGDMEGFDHQGKKLWSQSLGLPQNHYGHASSLQVYKDLLIIQYDQRTGSKIFALNTATGKTVWSTPRQVKVSWSSPILVPYGGKTEIITAADPYVACYDAATGAQLWQLDDISGEVGPSAAYANGIVFTVNDYSKLAAIKLGAQPVQLWENNEYLSDIPSPVATDKYLFLVTSYGVVACYDAVNGNKYWEKELNNSVFSSPVIAEGKVYLLDRTGLMHIFKVDKQYVSLGESGLGERSACTPAFSNGRIYLRGEKDLFCIGK